MEIMLAKQGVPRITKRPVLLVKSEKVNGAYPIVYFQKAKGIKQEDFDAVINFIEQQLFKK